MELESLEYLAEDVSIEQKASDPVYLFIRFKNTHPLKRREQISHDGMKPQNITLCAAACWETTWRINPREGRLLPQTQPTVLL